MDTIKFFLAAFFEKFKVKNPKVYLLIVSILIGVFAFLSSGEFAELTGSPAWLNTALTWLTVILGLLSGTHTSAITGKDKKVF